MKKTEIGAWIEDRIAADQRTIDHFARELAKDSFRALEWSMGAFDAAARLAVLRYVASLLCEGGFNHATELLRGLMMQSARVPARSSLPTSDLMERSRLAALAKVLETLEEARD